MKAARFLPPIIALTALFLLLPDSLPAGDHARLATPNPFTSGTVFDLTMPRTGRVKIVVFDLLGREVKVLEDNQTEFPKGFHKIEWDGNDRGGSPVIPGVYICVLFSEGVAVKSVKVVKVAS